MQNTTPNDSTYPGLQQVQAAQAANLGGSVAQALRLVWDQLRFIKQQLQGPQKGTIQPDQKPGNLQAQDAGAQFFATDFNRTFIWNGQTWDDAPTAPQRFLVGFFAASPEPPIGWFRCDGSAVTRSTSAGSTLTFATPVVPAYQGLLAWIRL